MTPAATLCPRCGLGIDSDGDGDCAVCHRMSPGEVLALRFRRMREAVDRAVDGFFLAHPGDVSKFCGGDDPRGPDVLHSLFRESVEKHVGPFRVDDGGVACPE